MPKFVLYSFLNFAIAGVLAGTGKAQDKTVPPTVTVRVAPMSPTSANDSDLLVPLKDPATKEQIREYLRLSGDLDSFRARWVAALDKNRSIGAPYWPEAFWTDLQAEMDKTDLLPMYITFFQHGFSRQLMQEILDAYQRLGAEHFAGSPECFKLGETEVATAATSDKLKLAKTLEVANKIYEVYKPQIKAARVRYIAEHPDYIDK